MCFPEYFTLKPEEKGKGQWKINKIIEGEFQIKNYTHRKSKVVSNIKATQNQTCQ